MLRNYPIWNDKGSDGSHFCPRTDFVVGTIFWKQKTKDSSTQRQTPQSCQSTPYLCSFVAQSQREGATWERDNFRIACESLMSNAKFGWKSSHLCQVIEGWTYGYLSQFFGKPPWKPAWNRGLKAKFWKTKTAETRASIDFIPRPVTPGVAGSSPVRSAIKYM